MSSVNLVYGSKSFAERATSAYREAILGADSVDISSPLSSGDLLRQITQAQTLNVSAKFSVASATVEILVVLWKNLQGTQTPAGFFKATLTAEADVTDGTKFYAPTEPFDLAGATHYEIRSRAPSAGNIDLFAWET